jgi:carbonic anhydrase
MELILRDNNVLHLLNSIKETNNVYTESKEQQIKSFAKSQTPACTLVMCCDSRAHSTSFTVDPENNFFIVRNIGNQYILNQGCIEFGVRVLNTPLLIFLGHTGCGAVKASMGNYSNLHSSIIREIDHLALSIKKSDINSSCSVEHQWRDAVINNVNQQVELALKDFNDLRNNKSLAIIGMVLDIDNSLQKGHGKISVTNLNGETNQAKLANNEFVKSFFN